MKCSNCGQEMSNEELFCSNCGFKQLQQPIINPTPINTPVIQKNKKNKSKIWIFVIVIVVLIIAIGAIISIINNSHSNSINDYSSYNDSYDQNYGDINNNESNDISGQVDKNENDSILIDMDKKMDSIVSSSNASVVGFALYDVNNSTIVTEGTTEKMTASALIVYPVLYAYNTLITDGVYNSYDELQLNWYSDGRGYFEKSNEGDYYTIEELFAYAFTYSDNNAINTLIENIGFSKIETICNNASYDVDVEKYLGVDGKNGADNRISASDLCYMIAEMNSRDCFANDVLNNYSYGAVNDEYGNIGIQSSLSGNYKTINGYTGSIYNEAVDIETYSNGQFIAVFLSQSDNYNDGASTAKELGEYLSECIE